jgi:DtxR family Mn-dependent transcriptional regulator
VHAEADKLEHVISEELEARIDEQLGYPTHDPHGDPIPDAGLNVDRTALRSLDTLVPGEAATVRRIPDGDADLLRYLAELLLVPGGKVIMRRSEPFGGPLTVDVAGSEHAISRELAGQIGVSG